MAYVFELLPQQNTNFRHYRKKTKSFILKFLKMMGFVPVHSAPPETSAPEDKIWEKDPDPRIKWALDILEPAIPERESLWDRSFWPGLGIVCGVLSSGIANGLRRRPMYGNALQLLAFGGAGAFFGERARIYGKQKIAEDIAMTKHYIMLHPERFPEPERVKYGDKRVFYPWPINRRG